MSTATGKSLPENRSNLPESVSSSTVTLASGRTGELLVPPCGPQMPQHALIRFPDGKVHWIIATAIKEVPHGVSSH